LISVELQKRRGAGVLFLKKKILRETKGKYKRTAIDLAHD
jgi:hypothetical protein